MNDGAVVDGVPLRVVELTGEPGDVILMHCDCFHAATPNRLTEPRMMLTGMVRPTAVSSSRRAPAHRGAPEQTSRRGGHPHIGIILECTILHISLVPRLCVEVCLALCTIVQESLPRGAKICGVGVSSCGSARMSSPRSLACLLVLSTHLSRANPPCDSTRCSPCSTNWV